MNKKIIGAIVAFVIVIICGYIYATPYLVLNTIKDAAKSGDSEKLSAYIDYPSVRQSFKDQMNAMMVKEVASKENNGWEALGAMMASAMVDKMVDAVVTPEGMTLMLQGKDMTKSLTKNSDEQTSQNTDDSKLDYKTRYLSMNMFEVSFKQKDSDKQVKAIMERDGLSWKVKKIVFPMDEMNSRREQPRPTTPVVEIPTKVEPPVITESSNTTFDFSGVQKGAQLESCYHDPCSIARVMGFEQLSQTPTETNIELTVVGGSRGWEEKNIVWNHESHKVQIQCSMTKPIVKIGDQLTVVPLNENGVPGVLWADAETYMQACHNYTGEMDAGIQKFGYNIQDVN